MKRISIHLFIHAIATVVLLILGFIAFSLHETVLGRPPARGASVGLSTELVMLTHLVINLMMALVPRVSLKIAGVIVFIVTTLHVLLPQHPVRALFMIVAGTNCYILAILICIRVPKQARVG